MRNEFIRLSNQIVSFTSQPSEHHLNLALNMIHKSMKNIEIQYATTLNTLKEEIKFLCEKWHKMATLFENIDKYGIKKNIHIDFSCDGYEMVKKQPQHSTMTPEEALDALLDQLPPVQRDIICYEYGLKGFPKISSTKVKSRLSLSNEQYVKQCLKSYAKLKMRKNRHLAENITHIELKSEILRNIRD